MRRHDRADTMAPETSVADQASTPAAPDEATLARWRWFEEMENGGARTTGSDGRTRLLRTGSR